MKVWIQAFVMVAPFGIVVGQFYDITDWRGWALFAAALWLREWGAYFDRKRMARHD